MERDFRPRVSSSVESFASRRPQPAWWPRSRPHTVYAHFVRASSSTRGEHHRGSLHPRTDEYRSPSAAIVELADVEVRDVLESRALYGLGRLPILPGTLSDEEILRALREEGDGEQSATK